MRLAKFRDLKGKREVLFQKPASISKSVFKDSNGLTQHAFVFI